MPRPPPEVVVTEPARGIRPYLPAGYGSGFETSEWGGGGLVCEGVREGGRWGGGMVSGPQRSGRRGLARGYAEHTPSSRAEQVHTDE